LDAEKADELLDSGLLNRFAVPPVVFKGETEITADSFSGEPAPVAFFNLADLVGFGGWVVAIVIVIAAALLVLNYVGGRKEEKPFGLDAAVGRSGLSSGFFDRFRGSGRKEEEPSGPRWGYRG